MPIVIALYAIVVILLVAAFALGWCHYDRHRILCFQASGPTSLIERPTIRIHPDTQRTCDNLGVAELVFLAIALIATYVRFFQQCYPHTVPFLLIGIVACLGITTVPLQLHALGACARWRKRRRLGPISDEELFARVSARDILPAQSAKHDFLYPQLSQPYCLAEKRELRDRIIQVRTDREG